MPPAFLIALICLPTLVALICGISLMAIGGEANRKYGVRLMRLRVISQGAAIIGVMALTAIY